MSRIENLVSINEAASRMGLSTSFIKKLLRDQKLERYKLGVKKTLVSLSELESLARPTNNLQKAEQVINQLDESVIKSLTDLSEHCKKLSPAEQLELIRTITEHAAQLQKVNP